MAKETCPTIEVDDGNGNPMLINETDFDPKKHTKLGEKKPVRRGRKPKAEA